MEDTKLWPLEQLFDWIDKSDSKFLNLNATELSITCAILKFANNETLTAYPSVARIANLSLKDKKQVRRILARLVKKNIFTIEERQKKSGDCDNNLYIFFPCNIWKSGAYSPLGRGKITPRVGVDLPPGRGKITPLTTNTTTPLTKPTGRWPKKDQELSPMASVDNQSTTYGYECETPEESQRKFDELYAERMKWQKEQTQIKPRSLKRFAPPGP